MSEPWRLLPYDLMYFLFYYTALAFQLLNLCLYLVVFLVQSYDLFMARRS